ncbi:MAG: DUF4340 domain-containing protein [Polyangiaceae bacterium]
MKSARALTPVVLVVLAAGATAYAYLVDGGTVSDADRAMRRADVFPSFRIDDVRSVELEQEGDRLALARSPNNASNWVLTSPRQEKADAGAVEALLRELELAKRLRAVPDSEATGFGSPRVRGKISVGRIEYAFALGGEAPRPDGAAYMRLEGEGAFVVDRALKVQLLRGSNAYRERSLVPYGAGEAATVEVNSPSFGFMLVRKGATFRLGGDRGLRASRAMVDRVFGAIADTRAEAFLDDASATRAMIEPIVTLRITSRDARHPLVRLRLGGTCPTHPGDMVVVREEPSHVCGCIARNVVDDLSKAGRELVDTHVFFARPDEIEELQLESLSAGGPRVDVARRGSGWHERLPQDREIPSSDSDSTNALVGDLANARALEVRPIESGDRLVPQVRVTAVRTGGGVREVIEIGGAGPDGVALARRLDDDAILLLRQEDRQRFEPHPIALQGPAVWPAPIDPATVVAIDDSCGPSAERLEWRDGRWVLRSPVGFAADSAAATELASAFAAVKADAWIAEADDGTFGLAPPAACTVRLTLSSGGSGGRPRSEGIVFGGEARGASYARSLDGRGVFLASTALRAQASRPAIDRGRLRFDLPSLTEVTLVRGTARVVFDGHGGLLVSSATGGEDASTDKMAAALAGLYAHEALHAGSPARGEGFERPTLLIDAIVRDDAGARIDTSVVIGAPTRLGGTEAYFARVSNIDATFAVPRPAVDAILDAWP